MKRLEIIQDPTIARATVNQDTCTLTLMAPSGFSEGTFYPAESITISDAASLRTLHTIIGDMLEEASLYSEDQQ